MLDEILARAQAYICSLWDPRERLYIWFVKHIQDLLEVYEGKSIVIWKNIVVASFDLDDPAAFKWAQEKFGDGAYLVQPCVRVDWKFRRLKLVPY